MSNAPIFPNLYSIEAEQMLLGILLKNNLSYDDINDFLLHIHFYQPAHQLLFVEIIKLINVGKVADHITLEMYASKNMSDMGGVNYLVKMRDIAGNMINIKDYGYIIYDLYLRRELVAIGQTLSHNAAKGDHSHNAQKCIETLEASIFKLTATQQPDVVTFHQILTGTMEIIKQAKENVHEVGVTTGFCDLDQWLGGLHKSDLLIVAGRPGMGKTALATNIIFNAAKSFKDDAVALFFSLEMSSEQLAMRILSQESGISSDQMRRGTIAGSDFLQLIDVSKKLTSIPLLIDDTPALNVSLLRSRVRKIARKHKLTIVAIDYLQLLKPSYESRFENRVQEISDITQALKAIAKEFDVPVIALSQLSRAVEQRPDKRPLLADLRESGTIEQDADIVMFVYREEYYKHREQPAEGTKEYAVWQEAMDDVFGKTELIVAKHRNGPVGTVKLFFDSTLTKFENFKEVTMVR